MHFFILKKEKRKPIAQIRVTAERQEKDTDEKWKEVLARDMGIDTDQKDTVISKVFWRGQEYFRDKRDFVEERNY